MIEDEEDFDTDICLTDRIGLDPESNNGSYTVDWDDCYFWGKRMSWTLLIILYTGEVKEVTYPSEMQCESALIRETDFGNRKHINVAECFIEE